MNKKVVALAAVISLLCIFAQSVFADIADPVFGRGSGGVVSVVLIIAVLAVIVALIIRRIRKGR
ncbi:MAG: hypothetical protein J5744_03410 [Oscillospiraceae bacterium]|nr:hypothetical protein [Oscillospiraceae bacterium]